LQVTGAEVMDGKTVKLTVEPAKGGDSETLEADVVLVSAGAPATYPAYATADTVHGWWPPASNQGVCQMGFGHPCLPFCPAGVL